MAVESAHAQQAFEDEHAELESRADRTTREGLEAATSGHLVRLVDFFFALVLGQGFIRYESVFKAPWNADLAVLLALVTVYYTVVRSFVAWHLAQEGRRYRIVSRDAKTTELWRVYIDIAIVGTYAFLLLAAEPLMKDSAADVHPFFAGFVVLFLLYAAWGYLRRVAWGKDDYKLWSLFVFAGLYTGLWIMYRYGPDVFSTERSNELALGTAFVLMALYRYVNWWQYGALDSSGLVSRRRRLFQLPSLKVRARW